MYSFLPPVAVGTRALFPWCTTRAPASAWALRAALDAKLLCERVERQNAYWVCAVLHSADGTQAGSLEHMRHRVHDVRQHGQEWQTHSSAGAGMLSMSLAVVLLSFEAGAALPLAAAALPLARAPPFAAA